MTSSTNSTFSFPNLCNIFFESETCDHIQSQFSHFMGKAKQIDFNTFFNYAFPVTIAAYSIYQSMPLLFGAMRGYDSVKMRAKFKDQALTGLSQNQKPLSFSERATYLKQYAFGSISIKNRLYLSAKALSWLALATLALIPLFKKVSDANNIPITPTIIDPNQLQSSIEGKEKQWALQKLSALPTMTPYLNQERIDPQLQTILTQALAPESKLSLLQQTSQYFGYSNQTKPLFSEIEGHTVVDAKILEEQCQATLSQIDTLVVPDFKQRLASGLGAVCNATIGYTPWSESCQSFYSWLTPYANTTTQGLVKAQVQIACAVLGERARNDAMLADFTPFISATKSLLSTKPLAIEGQEGMPCTYNLEEGAKFFNDRTRLEKLCMSGSLTQKCQDLVRSMFPISSDSAINSTTIKRAYRDFSKAVHPDKCPEELKVICQNIFDAGTKLKEIIMYNQLNFNPTNASTSSQYYTLSELWQRLLHWYHLPV